MKYPLFMVCGVMVAQSLVIQNVTVVDVVGGGLKPSVNVAIKDGKIASIGSAKAPSGAQLVDGTGKFLMPGMWEEHAHVWESEPLFYLYIGAGVTGVRDLGSAIKPFRQWESEVKSGKRIGPRLVTAGAPVTGPGPNPWPKLPEEAVTTAADGRAVADKLKAAGSDFIKPLSVPREAYFAMTARARELKIPVAGHVPPSVSVREAVDAGQKTIEHMPYALACSSLEDQVWKARQEAEKSGKPAVEPTQQQLRDTFDEKRCRDLFSYIQKKGVFVTPTIFSPTSDVRSGAAKRYPALKYVPENLVKEWDKESPSTPETPAQAATAEKNFEYSSRIIKIMRDAKVDMLAGTDSGDPWKIPGFVVHSELQTLVKAGLSPLQALRTATLEPAKLIGMEKTLGSVDVGKEADLVLLSADPLSEISNTQKIESVFVKGKYLDRSQLDKMLSAKKD